MNSVLNCNNVSEDNNNCEVDSEQWSGNFDTGMQPADFRELNRILSVAPAEGNTLLGMFQDVNAEFLSFPTIYCGENRQNNNSSTTPVHYSTICKWELRNADRRIRKDITNIFFKLKKLQILFWVDRAPKLGLNTKEEIGSFIDKYVTCKKNAKIPDLVNHQTHRHASTCRKKGKSICRFGFPLPPLDKTMIPEGLEDNMSSEEICKAHNL